MRQNSGFWISTSSFLSRVLVWRWIFVRNAVDFAVNFGNAVKCSEIFCSPHSPHSPQSALFLQKFTAFTAFLTKVHPKTSTRGVSAIRREMVYYQKVLRIIIWGQNLYFSSLSIIISWKWCYGEINTWPGCSKYMTRVLKNNLIPKIHVFFHFHDFLWCID